MDPGHVALLFALAIFAAFTWRAVGRGRGGAAVQTGEPDPSRPDADAPGRPDASPGGAPPGGSTEERTHALYALVAELNPVFQAVAHPADLAATEAFENGVRHFSDPFYGEQDLLKYYTGSEVLPACLALEALARRRPAEALLPAVLGWMNEVHPWTRFFCLRVVGSIRGERRNDVGSLLAALDESWAERPVVLFLAESLRAWSEAGPLTFGGALPAAEPEAVKTVLKILQRADLELVRSLRDELQAHESERVDAGFLAGLGRVWDPASDPGARALIDHPALRAHVERVLSGLRGETTRSALLVGPSGVGKTTIVRAVAERLAAEKWIVFEAGAAELIAGTPFVSQLEERVRQLLKSIGGRRILWLVPEFHKLLWAGQHFQSPVGALDLLLPAFERGEVTALGETQEGHFERLAQARPQVLSALTTYRVVPLGEAETLELVDRWAEAHSQDPAVPLMEAAARREAWQLALQFLGGRAAPGSVLDCLERTLSRLRSSPHEGPIRIGRDDLIVTLGSLTGLPAAILDERQELDLPALRALFECRVLGQPEAVDCLVERVAMIKAGVTDPTRPLGVFLFVGPTGTGKTEIAKTLAEFLFGSPTRMIRLDMSEFQAPDSLARLFGEPRPDEMRAGGSLAELIRKQPFSVVLLDEFEKAHPNVWNIFLQVFDDGRLTDHRGNLADFRHAIVIMTSNVRADVPDEAGLGFSRSIPPFSPEGIRRAVRRTFPPEFVNRVDREVVFRPLGRETMREILRKELGEAFQRRGLRHREWAVEWDDSALEFLLEKGFTHDLGARPLKRSIERYLLAPLSLTIVNHQVPEGDQFLFVRADGGSLVVDFIDPDAPDAAARAAPERETRTGEQGGESETDLRLEALVLGATGTTSEIACLRSRLEDLRHALDCEPWRGMKANLYRRTHEVDFWSSPGRFTTLSRLEYVDRIEASARGSASLLERLGSNATRGRDRVPRELVGRLAQQLYLLEAARREVIANRPWEAFLMVEAWGDGAGVAEASNSFSRVLGDMYRGWCAKRHMQMEVIEGAGSSDPGPYRLVLAIGGFAAYAILEKEEGLHVFETPPTRGEKSHRATARVRVAIQPEAPLPRRHRHAAALEALRSRPHEGLGITRRYRESPSPLVRDSARGWRTGRLDRVLAGDFDLIGAAGS